MNLGMIVAIVGILRGISYPAYTDSVDTGKRGEARASVTDLLQQQKRYFTQMNTYGTFATGTPGSLPLTVFSAGSGGRAASIHVLGARLCQAVGNNIPTRQVCIEAFAVPQTCVFADPSVTSMAIDTQRRRTCTGAQIDGCWK